jgi:hypothetical protein
MKRRSSLVTALLLGFAAIGSLGATDCSEEIGGRLLEVVADHEQRLDALERCDCDGVLAPVCGDDGKTYVNVCEARCAGAEVASHGRCERANCGGAHGVACGEGELCETRPGCDAMAAGICIEIPETCTDEWAPVCGCDGTTYSNDCDRRAAGVAIDFRGSCEAAPVRCADNEGCVETEYCRKRDGICDTRGGVCTARPEACTLDYDPVCGCDGETYSNSCAAAAAGVSVLEDGECAPAPVACHDNRDCADEEFCRKRVDMCESEGRCAPRPEVCPLYSEPVCGCDGATYANRCEAFAAGVSVASHDACRRPPVPICHRPPGNRENRHTLFVDESAVPAHLAHGDSRGHCRHGDDDEDSDEDDD